MIVKAKIPVKDGEKDIKDNLINKGESKIEIETRINHEGEVNRARPMPQKPNIIATKTNKGEVHIFDYHKHSPRPADNIVKPEIRLLGHTCEGYALSWNTVRQGYLLSGASDSKVNNELLRFASGILIINHKTLSRNIQIFIKPQSMMSHGVIIEKMYLHL
jgi:histone-binding protein RBBP4